MLESLDWIALEVKYLDRAREVYEGDLDLTVRDETESEITMPVGHTDLILRSPSTVPRGGVHVHFAFTTPSTEYEDWWNRLERNYNLEEHVFGSARSLYFHDDDDHCVEIGQRGTEGSGLTGIFEVVLEVEKLGRAERFYRGLGFDPVDRGDRRRRVRLQGPVDLELWEPQLGLADARGGVHLDLGFAASSLEIPSVVGDLALAIDSTGEHVRIRCPEGHYITIRQSDERRS